MSRARSAKVEKPCFKATIPRLLGSLSMGIRWAAGILLPGKAHVSPQLCIELGKIVQPGSGRLSHSQSCKAFHSLNPECTPGPDSLTRTSLP